MHHGKRGDTKPYQDVMVQAFWKLQRHDFNINGAFFRDTRVILCMPLRFWLLLLDSQRIQFPFYSGSVYTPLFYCKVLGSFEVRPQCSFFSTSCSSLLCPTEAAEFWLRHPLLLFSPFPTHCGHLNHVYPENLPEHLQGCSPNFLSDRLSHLFIVSSPVMSFSGVSSLNPALLQHGSKRSHYSSSADPGIPLYWRKLAFRGKRELSFLLLSFVSPFFLVLSSPSFSSVPLNTKLEITDVWIFCCTLCERCKSV